MAVLERELDRPERRLEINSPSSNTRSSWVFTLREKDQRPIEILVVHNRSNLLPATIVNMLMEVLIPIVDDIMWLRNSWDGKLNLEILRFIEVYTPVHQS